MSLPRTVAEVLAEHVTLEVEGIDRMYLNVYLPRLQHARRGRGVLPLPPRSALRLLGADGADEQAFIAAVERFVREQDVPLITFAKGQRKDDIAKEYLARFRAGDRGDLFVGKAQEKTPVFRTEKRRNPETGRTYPWIVRTTAMVNQYYFYCVDEDFGPFFLKFCTYFPYNAKLCINGHEYVKRQLAKEGIAFEALDNGILSCADPKRLQRLCDGLSAAEDRCACCASGWTGCPIRSPPRIAQAGYRYDVSILQAEFSLTQVLDRPLTGPDLLRGGDPREPRHRPARPGATDLRSARHASARRGGSAPACITEGVTPSLHVDYKHSRIKQYHKEGRALRTETTINDTRDFGIGKRLTNLPALRQIGFEANRRLLDVQRISQDCASRRRRVRSGHSARSRSTGSGPPRCASPTGACRRCSRRWWCSVSCPGASPTATCASTGLPSWASLPADMTPGQDDLRPAPAAPARPDRADPTNPPLPAHAGWTPCCALLHPHLRPSLPLRDWLRSSPPTLKPTPSSGRPSISLTAPSTPSASPTSWSPET